MSGKLHREIDAALREVEAARVLMAQLPSGAALACLHLKRAARIFASLRSDAGPAESPWLTIESVLEGSSKPQWKAAAVVVDRTVDRDVGEEGDATAEVEAAAATVCDLLESALSTERSGASRAVGRHGLLRKAAPAVLALSVLGGAIWLYASLTSPAARARARVPRIVVVTLDAFHVAHTGPYNLEVGFTPFLSRFASEGVQFASAYAHTSSTLPSHASLMSGVSPAALGVMADQDRIPEDAEMLAETFQRAGYRTAAFISLGALRQSLGTAQGFDTFANPFDTGPERRYRRADEVFESVASWLREHRESPFFLWVHLSDSRAPYVTAEQGPDTELWLDGTLVGRFHLAKRERESAAIELSPGIHELKWVALREPRPDDLPNTGLELFLEGSDELADVALADLPAGYAPVRPELRLELRNPDASPLQVEMSFSGRLRQPVASEVLPNYDANVAYVDHYLGELDTLMEEIGVRETTLFVIVSDHGEGLYDHDILGHDGHVYEDQMRVVWLMRGPGIPKGKVVDARPALLIDVAPTLLGVLGLGSRGMEGRSLVGCWDGSGCPEIEPWWAFGINRNTRGLTSMASYRWPYKWLWRRGVPRIAFDVAADPWESSDLLSDGAGPTPESIQQSAEAFRAQRQYLADALKRSAP